MFESVTSKRIAIFLLVPTKWQSLNVEVNALGHEHVTKRPEDVASYVDVEVLPQIDVWYLDASRGKALARHRRESRGKALARHRRESRGKALARHRRESRGKALARHRKSLVRRVIRAIQ
jgi:hypothetical protein